MIKLGHCFECKRLMPIKWLRQIEYYEGHFAKGDIHHELCCPSCIEKAEELGEVFEELRQSNKVNKIIVFSIRRRNK